MNVVVEAEDPSLEAASSPEVASDVNVYVHSVEILVFCEYSWWCVALVCRKDKAPTGSVVTDEEARQVEEEERKKTEKQEEKRIDDLWSSFKQETATRLLPPVAKEPSDCSKASTEPPLKVYRYIDTYIHTYIHTYICTYSERMWSALEGGGSRLWSLPSSPTRQKGGQ